MRMHPQLLLHCLPLRYIFKNEMISLSYDVNDQFSVLKIHLLLYGFSQYRSYTDFHIKLDGFVQIGVGLLNYYGIKQVLISSKLNH